MINKKRLETMGLDLSIFIERKFLLEFSSLVFSSVSRLHTILSENKTELEKYLREKIKDCIELSGSSELSSGAEDISNIYGNSNEKPFIPIMNFNDNKDNNDKNDNNDHEDNRDNRDNNANNNDDNNDNNNDKNNNKDDNNDNLD